MEEDLGKTIGNSEIYEFCLEKNAFGGYKI